MTDAQQLGERSPKAAKNHRCDYCGDTIMKGERYHRVAILGDGEFFMVKAHRICSSVAHWGYTYGDTIEICRDAVLEPLRDVPWDQLLDELQPDPDQRFRLKTMWDQVNPEMSKRRKRVSWRRTAMPEGRSSGLTV